MRKLLLVTAATCVFSTAVLADETVKMKSVYHQTTGNSEPAFDVPGHTMYLVRGEGVNLLPDGQVVLGSYIAAADYINGSGSAVTYYEMTFPDGSLLYFKGAVTATVKGNNTELSIPITITGGTGKYVEAKGDGFIFTTRYAPRPGVGAHLVSDTTLNIRK
jgi:hypothetical protein